MTSRRRPLTQENNTTTHKSTSRPLRHTTTNKNNNKRRHAGDNHAEETFSKLGIKAQLADRLYKNGILHPTPVQEATIPHLLKKQSAVIAAQTGTGKSLAYLLPIIQTMSSSRCSHLIVVPTRELAAQVHKELIKYGVHTDAVSRAVSGLNELNERSPSAVLKSPIIIATPKRLLDLLDNNPKHFRRVKTVVLDEVDKLLLGSNLKADNKKGMSKKTRPTEKVNNENVQHRLLFM